MEAAIERKQTSFRLSTDLIDRLRLAAKKEHRSLNNFVERALMDLVYNEPNAVTIAAIEEARSEKKSDTFDSVDNLMEELMK